MNDRANTFNASTGTGARHPRALGTVSNSCAIIQARIAVYERALARGHMSEAQHQLSQLVPHLRRLALLAKATQPVVHLETAMLEAAEGVATFQRGKDGVVIIEGVFNVAKLGEKLIW